MIWKELRVAFLCGVSLAAANFVKMLLVDRLLLGNTAVTMSVAATVCCTIVFVVMFAKAVGSLLPMIAEKMALTQLSWQARSFRRLRTPCHC